MSDRTLHQAGYDEDINELQEICDRLGRDANERGGERMETPLIFATRNAYIEIVSLLSSCSDIQLDAVDSQGCSALHRAVETNIFGLVTLLYTAGVDVNLRSNAGESPLMLAAHLGHIAIVRYLSLLPEMELNARDDEGRTALAIAALHNKGDVVTYLSDLPGIEQPATATPDTAKDLVNHAGEIFAAKAAASDDDIAAPDTISKAVDVEDITIEQITTGVTSDAHFYLESSMRVARHISASELDYTTISAAAISDTATSEFAAVLAARAVSSAFAAIAESAASEVFTAARTAAAYLASKFAADNESLTSYDEFTESCSPLLEDSQFLTLFTTAKLAEIDAKAIKNFCKRPTAQLNAKDSEGRTALIMAAQHSQTDLLKFLTEAKATEVNARDNEGNTAAHYIAARSNWQDLKFLRRAGARLNIKNDAGRTPVEEAVIHNNIRAVQFMVAEPVHNFMTSTGDAETKQATEDLVDVLKSTSDGRRAEVSAAVLQQTGILLTLKDNCSARSQHRFDEKLTDDTLKTLKLLTDGLSNIADKPRQCNIFYKGKLYIDLIEIFVDDDIIKRAEIDEAGLLRTLYICFQAHIKCTDKPKEFLQIKLGDELYLKFNRKIALLAEGEHTVQIMTDSQLSSLYILQTYMTKEEEEVSTKFTCCTHTSSLLPFQHRLKTLCNLIKRFISGCLKTGKNDGEAAFYHKCRARGKLTLLTCLVGLYFYTSDVLTDYVVGLEDYSHVSPLLGTFQIALVTFTLLHENFWSAIELYVTEEELLMMNLGKSELDDEDWSQSELNWSNHWFLGLLCYFVPYKINGGAMSKAKALIGNMLTLLMLRPVADRIFIVFHDPTSRRVYYRLSAKRNTLRQFYIILEQFPELILQFYTFQIVFNKALQPCGFIGQASYSTEHAENNYICTKLDIDLALCGELFRAYSMALAFFNAPVLILLLECDFRKLDPAMPRISPFEKNTLQTVYIMMIPARLFLFSGLLHAEPKTSMVIYLGFRSLWELFVNLTLHGQYTKFTNINFKNEVDENGTLRQRVLKMLGAFWMCWLFSIRDVFIISLRNPIAYMNKISEVNHRSIRSWKMIGLLSCPYIIEGFLGAILIEQDYPCGGSADIFRYLGWFCLTLLIFSVTLMVLVADFLNPTLTKIISHKFLSQSLFVISCGMGLFVIAGGTFFANSNNGRSEEEVCVFGGVVLTYIITFGLFIGLTKRFGEAKRRSKIKVNSDEERWGGTFWEEEDCNMCCLLYSAVCLPCCKLCQRHKGDNDRAGLEAGK